MRKLRCYCQDIQSESILDAVESGHLCRVLRAQEGTAVELFDGKGTLASGTVLRSNKKEAVIRVHQIDRHAPSDAPRLILAVSFAKGQRFDWLVEKCTELGVEHIAAVQFERTVKLGRNTALERYRKISLAAAKQSKRLFLPKISGPEKFPVTLDFLIGQYPRHSLVYGDPRGMSLSDLPVDKTGQDCIAMVGPEGGFSDLEIGLLKEKGADGVMINNNILRIETAAVAFCAIAAVRHL